MPAFDVIVMGFGVGTAACAAQLARKGVRTAFVAGEEEMPEGAAGSPKGTLASYSLISAPFIRNYVTLGRIVSPVGNTLELRHSDGGFVVDYRDVQQYFLDQLISAGGQLISLLHPRRIVSTDGEFTSIEASGPGNGIEALAAEYFACVPAVLPTLVEDQSRPAGSPLMQYVQYCLPNMQFPPHLIEIYVGSQFAQGSYIWVVSLGGDHGVIVGWGMPVASNEVDDYRRRLRSFTVLKVGRIEMRPLECASVAPFATQSLVIKNLLVVPENSGYSGFLPGIDIGAAIHAGYAAAESIFAAYTSPDKNHAFLQQHYVGKLASRQHIPPDRLAKIRRVLNEVSDEELDDLITGIREVVGTSNLSVIDPLPTLLRVVKKKPRLWKLARHLF